MKQSEQVESTRANIEVMAEQSAEWKMLSLAMSSLVRHGVKLRESTRIFRVAYVRHAIVENKGNKCAAARALGVHRNQIQRIIGGLS